MPPTVVTKDQSAPRAFKDRNTNVEKAHPAANASASTDAIDLGVNRAGVNLDEIDVRIYSEAVPNLADTKTATLTVEDSADNSSFSPIAGLSTLVQTGASSAGAAAATRTIKLPPSTRRYVRVTSAIVADGGNNTAKKFGMDFLY